MTGQGAPYPGAVVECPGSTTARRHVIARDARACLICGWIRGERDALRLQPVESSPRISAPNSGRRRWLTVASATVLAIGVAGSAVAAFRPELVEATEMRVLAGLGATMTILAGRAFFTLARGVRDGR